MTSVTDIRAGIAGLLFVAVALVDTAMNGAPPALSLGARALAQYFANQGSVINSTALLSVMITPAITWYLVRLVTRCQRAGQPTLAVAVLVLSAAAGALFIGSWCLFHAASLLASSQGPETVFGLVVASALASAQLALCLGLLMLVVSVVVYRSLAFDAWYGWFGFFTSAVAIGTSAAALTSLSRLGVHGFGLLAFLVWVGCGSVLFIRGRGELAHAKPWV